MLDSGEHQYSREGKKLKAKKRGFYFSSKIFETNIPWTWGFFFKYLSLIKEILICHILKALFKLNKP